MGLYESSTENTIRHERNPLDEGELEGTMCLLHGLPYHGDGMD